MRRGFFLFIVQSSILPLESAEGYYDAYHCEAMHSVLLFHSNEFTHHYLHTRLIDRVHADQILPVCQYRDMHV
jgi:hypothetical protein